eukprot:UN26419
MSDSHEVKQCIKAIQIKNFKRFLKYVKLAPHFHKYLVPRRPSLSVTSLASPQPYYIAIMNLDDNPSEEFLTFVALRKKFDIEINSDEPVDNGRTQGPWMNILQSACFSGLPRHVHILLEAGLKMEVNLNAETKDLLSQMNLPYPDLFLFSQFKQHTEDAIKTMLLVNGLEPDTTASQLRFSSQVKSQVKKWISMLELAKELFKQIFDNSSLE